MDTAVEEVAHVHHGAADRHSAEVHQLGLVGSAGELVVAEHDVVQAGAAVDQDGDALVVRLHPQLHQLPEQLLLTARIEISSYDRLVFCI